MSEWVSFFCSFVAFHPAYQLRGCALTTEESFSRLCRWTCIFCRKSSNARGAIATTATTIFYYYHHFFLLSPEAIVHFLPTCSSFLGWLIFMHLNIRLIVVCVCVWMHTRNPVLGLEKQSSPDPPFDGSSNNAFTLQQPAVRQLFATRSGGFCIRLERLYCFRGGGGLTTSMLIQYCTNRDIAQIQEQRLNLSRS